jgi:cyclic pyranopterin phosphate synthase
MPEEGLLLKQQSKFMTVDEIDEIARQFVDHGITKIRLTGGEPLVHKYFDEIVQKLSKLPVELSLTTNAILLDKHIDTILDAGIKKINISLDTLDKDRFKTITRRDEYDRTMKNIELAINRGLQVKLNVVLIKDFNDDEIIEFVKWTTDKPINVRFIEFMPFDGNEWKWEKKVSEQEVLDRLYSAFSEDNVLRIQDAPNDTAHNYQLLGAKGTFGLISTVTNPFCDTCNRVRLTADGKIKNCLFSSSETDLLTPLRNGEPINNLILNSVQDKKASRGGLSIMDDNSVDQLENRAMISIGG